MSINGERVGVIIPAYGLVEMTQTIVRDCLREPVEVFVVDNGGDYAAIGSETVIRPGSNLGWLRGTNAGLHKAAASGVDHLVALNNDTRLAAGFFSGLAAAAGDVDSLGLLAPSYDDVVAAQRHFTGPADEYVPEDREDQLKLIDGTCFLVPTAVFRSIGDLDGKHFGRRGWGAIEDYCIRVRQRGLKVAVTRRAYLTHARGTTAATHEFAYRKYANSEFRRGMRRKWGPGWREWFDADTVPIDTPRQRVEDLARLVEDRLHLTNTRIGRRGL